MSSAGSLGNPSTGSTVATNINANTNNIDDTSSSSDSDHDRKTGADAGSGKSELSSEASRRPSEISTNSRTNMEGRREVVVAVDAAAPITDTADSCGTTGGRHSGILTHDRQSSIFAGSRASVFSEQQTFPGMVHEDDADVSRNVDEAGKDNTVVVRLLEKIPESVWLPNMVRPRYRWRANCYWILLLIGYLIYTFTALKRGFDRRSNPPVELELVEEPFQLPDVRFCFEGDTYGSRVGCWDDESNGAACAESFEGDVFVYGYNYTGYTTPEGYPYDPTTVVMLPEQVSDTCTSFKLSILEANQTAQVWNFHMLVFWNSFYNATANRGAHESVKLYLTEGGADEKTASRTPISLYAPISFDPAEVPFVRGFLTYSQSVNLAEEVSHTYTVVDTTVSAWHNAENAESLAELWGTDTLASIQFDIRAQSYQRLTALDPLDIVGTLGEISGFWLVVPLMFGVLFYRPGDQSERTGEMRRIRLFGSKTRIVDTPSARRLPSAYADSDVDRQRSSVEDRGKRLKWPRRVGGVSSFEQV